MEESKKSGKYFRELNIPEDMKIYDEVKFVLKSRLPQSSHIYNMAQWLPSWKNKMSFHTLCDFSEQAEAVNVDNQSWIIVKLFREVKDMGTGFAISPPLEAEITGEIEETFSTGGLIDWSGQYHFPALDRAVSPMIMKISAFTKCNITRINPCYFFYKDISEAKEAEIVSNEDTVIRPLDLETGIPFIMDQWKYAVQGTDAYLPEVLKRNHSMGVYVQGNLVCGVVTHINGTIGGLNTLEEFRRRGYGQNCIQALMKRLAEDDCIPFSAAEVANKASVEFHKKLGMTLYGVMDYISSPSKDLAS